MVSANSVDLRPAPPQREVLGNWVQSAGKPSRMTGPNEFCFLNETHMRSSPPQIGIISHGPKLWLYNLHYFDDLNADTSQQRDRLASGPHSALDRRESSLHQVTAGSLILCRYG